MTNSTRKWLLSRMNTHMNFYSFFVCESFITNLKTQSFLSKKILMFHIRIFINCMQNLPHKEKVFHQCEIWCDELMMSFEKNGCYIFHKRMVSRQNEIVNATDIHFWMLNSYDICCI